MLLNENSAENSAVGREHICGDMILLIQYLRKSYHSLAVSLQKNCNGIRCVC